MRIENWPTALAGIVAEAEHKPFVCGVHDCCTFAASAERVLTGATVFEDALGNYRTAIGGARKLRKLGFKSVEEIVSSRLEEVTPAFARRGDWVVVDGELGPAIGVVTGENAVSPCTEGLMHYPVTAARRAWRVG